MTTAEEVVYCALYKWLEKRDKAYYCKLCSKAQKTNSFTKGKHTSLVEKYLKRHEACADHQDALNPRASPSTSQDSQPESAASTSSTSQPAQSPQPFPTQAFPNLASMHKQQKQQQKQQQQQQQQQGAGFDRSRALAEGQRVAAKVMNSASQPAPVVQQPAMAPPLPQGCVEIAPIIDLPPHRSGNGSSTSSPSTPVIELPTSAVSVQSSCQTVPKVINEEYLRSLEGQKMFRILLHSRPGCKITMDWFRDFGNFLEWDVGKDLIGCLFCRQTTSTGALAVGKPTKLVNRCDLTVHRDTDTHRMIFKHFTNFSFKPPAGRITSIPNCPRDLLIIPNQEFLGPQAASRSMRMAPSPGEQVPQQVRPQVPPPRPAVIPKIFNIESLADEVLVCFLLHSHTQMTMNHRFVPGYFREFPWLDLDMSTLMYYCRFCRPTGMGIMSRGKEAHKINRTDLIVHTQTQQHHEVMRRLDYQNRMAQQHIPNGNPPDFFRGFPNPPFPNGGPPNPFPNPHQLPPPPFPSFPASHMLTELQGMCDTLPARSSGSTGVIQSPPADSQNPDASLRKPREKPIHIGIEDSIDLDPDSPVKAPSATFDISQSESDRTRQNESETSTQNETDISTQNESQGSKRNDNKCHGKTISTIKQNTESLTSHQNKGNSNRRRPSTSDNRKKNIESDTGNRNSAPSFDLPNTNKTLPSEGSSSKRPNSRSPQRTSTVSKAEPTFSVGEPYSVKEGTVSGQQSEQASNQMTSAGSELSAGVSISSCQLSDEQSDVYDSNSELNSFKDSFWQLANVLRQQNSICDVTFVVITPGGDLRKFRAHKLIVACASEFWRIKFDEECNNTFVFEHSDVSTQGLQGVLDYLYGQNIQGGAKYLKLCYKAAKFLNIPSALRTFRALLEVKCSRMEFVNFTMDVNYSHPAGSYLNDDNINDETTQPGQVTSASRENATVTKETKQVPMETASVAMDTTTVAMGNRESESPYSNPSSHPSTVATEDESTAGHQTAKDTIPSDYNSEKVTSEDNCNSEKDTSQIVYNSKKETNKRDKESNGSDDEISQPSKKRKNSSLDETDIDNNEKAAANDVASADCNYSKAPPTIISYTFGRKSTEMAVSPAVANTPQNGDTTLNEELSDEPCIKPEVSEATLQTRTRRKCYMCRASLPCWTQTPSRSELNRHAVPVAPAFRRAVVQKCVLCRCQRCSLGALTPHSRRALKHVRRPPVKQRVSNNS